MPERTRPGKLNAVVHEGLCDRRPIGAISRRTIGHRHNTFGPPGPGQAWRFGPVDARFDWCRAGVFHVERARMFVFRGNDARIAQICHRHRRSRELGEGARRDHQMLLATPRRAFHVEQPSATEP
jgi:hypothetical protein